MEISSSYPVNRLSTAAMAKSEESGEINSSPKEEKAESSLQNQNRPGGIGTQIDIMA
jgi:hypothetical protein